MQHKRAVNDSEKQERRAAILSAAMELFLASSFDAVTMQAVATRAGIAKGTSYLYFRTKEEVFLALLNEEVARWLKSLRERLAALPGKDAPPAEQAHACAAAIAASLEGQTGFTRLVALAHAILEQNLTPSVALSFKRRLRLRFTAAGQQMENSLSFLLPGEGAELILTIYAMVIGLQGLAEPPAAVIQALEEGDLGLFRIQLSTALGKSIEALLLGMAARA